MSRMIPVSMMGLLLAVPLAVGADGLTYAKQVIFGMDCAPCAYGVEQGLKKLPGVQAVKVSLNEGFAEVTLSDSSPVTLADIRAVILKNGFTPKAAHVRLSGTVSVAAHGAPLSLHTDGLEVSILVADENLKRRLLERTGRQVALEGEIPAETDRQISVQAVASE